jgi:hypothetical protein
MLTSRAIILGILSCRSSEADGSAALQGSGMSSGGPNLALSGIQLGGDSATAAHTAEAPSHHETDLIGYEVGGSPPRWV